MAWKDGKFWGRGKRGEKRRTLLTWFPSASTRGNLLTRGERPRLPQRNQPNNKTISNKRSAGGDEDWGTMTMRSFGDGAGSGPESSERGRRQGIGVPLNPSSPAAAAWWGRETGGGSSMRGLDGMISAPALKFAGFHFKYFFHFSPSTMF